MKDKKSTQKMFIKVFSIFAAIVLWLFVSYTEDNLMDVNIKSIEIQYVGEQALASKGLMVVDKVSVPKASVKIRGRRSDLISVMGGVIARVDLSQINREGTYELSPIFDIPSSAVYVSKVNTQSVKLNIAKTVEKTVPVEIVQENAEKNKEYIVQSVPEFQEMKIVGAKNDLDYIQRATLYVDVSFVAGEEEQMIKPVLESDEGKQALPINEIFTEISEIKVTNHVYSKKAVDVVVELPSMEEEGYAISLISQSVDKVEVGVVDADTQPETITANFDDITIIESGKQKFLLKLSVPDGVYLPEANQFVEVEIDVKEYSKQYVKVPITVKNAGEKNYQLKIDYVILAISGPEDKLSRENVKAELDLSGIEADGQDKRIQLDISSKTNDVKVENEAVFATVVVE